MFQRAKAIFGEIAPTEMHVLVRFTAMAEELGGTMLHIAAADFYRVYVDDVFVAFGPARTAAGYARVDTLTLPKGSRLAIEVLSHNCKSLSTVKQPPFLLAEVTRGGEPILYTGRDFSAVRCAQFVQATERYSNQRHFTEEWDLRAKDSSVPVCLCEKVPTLLSRRVPYPHYADLSYTEAAVYGCLAVDPDRGPRSAFYSFFEEDWGHFPEDSVRHLYTWVDRQKQTPVAHNRSLPLSLTSDQYAIFDLGQIECGFLSLAVESTEETELVVAFSEDAKLPTFSFTDMHAHNVFGIILPAGKAATVMTFEPYVCRYVMVAVMRGRTRLHELGMKTYMADLQDVKVPTIVDPCLARIYRGAMRTYAHNAVDLYTDCPSRERAGWLCDTYFTAKAEYALFGHTLVEDAFLENYRLFVNNGEYPEGVLPMCYPSDKKTENSFIPQWNLWYILEVAEYLLDRGNADQTEAFRSSVFGVLSFFARYENSDGLLEGLPAWNFVEWSVANKWTQDVNYPTNFLYAEALTCVYRVYGDQACLQKAKHVREMAKKQSFDGTLFHDHAVRGADGRLSVLSDVSEACQYYALLFGDIDPTDSRYGELLRLVREIFGADRTTLREEIAPINAFIGVYLRLELLRRLGAYSLLLHDVRGFFGEMEARTGTLWEYREPHGSRDHGFASYALVAIREALEHPEQ